MGMIHSPPVVLFVIVLFTCYAWGDSGPPSPSTNGTLTNEGNGSRVYCEKTKWYDVLWFIFSNYLLHALSVRSLPGENFVSSTVFKLCCFLIPFTGIRRGLGLILRATNLAPNDLQAAARANALCMVIRTPEWRPKEGEVIQGCQVDNVGTSTTALAQESGIADLEKQLESNSSAFDASQTLGTSFAVATKDAENVILKTRDIYEPPPLRNLTDSVTRRLIQSYRFDSRAPSANLVDHKGVKIHGLCRLAPGYCLAYVPMDMKVFSRTRFRRRMSFAGILGMDTAPEIKLASTYDIPRILFSLIQTVSGGYALYRARGAQINKFGASAYGLTVLPYMVVSVVNLIGSLLTSEYETMYQVHSAIMDEMNTRGGICDGVVGSIEDPEFDDTRSIDGEERTVAIGETIVFDGLPRSLISQEISESLASCQKPVAASKWWEQMGLTKPSLGRCYPYRSRNKQKTEETPRLPSITVPSHSTFTRISPPVYQTYLSLLTIMLLILSFAVPYIVITILTGWKYNQSTSTARSFTINWLILGQIQGWAVGGIEKITGRVSSVKGLLVTFVIYGSYTVGGIVIVTEEMVEFGLCKAI
ncbi:MAG: hypothetical protein Q9167_004410 [Letrouitia subvulpina]